MIRELIEHIAKDLVDFPEQVSVSEIKGGHTSVIELRVAKEDLGKVIGKQGRIANAMRVLLNAACAKLKQHAVLEIIDPARGPVAEEDAGRFKHRADY